MNKKNAFVKISGDLIDKKEVIDWLKELSEKHFIVICTGGGTQINEEFQKRGYEIKFGPLGREIDGFEGRQLARDLLEQNQAEIQDYISDNGIIAQVIIPVIEVGNVLCHVNGDIYTLASYNGFDELFILTLKERMEKKIEEFEKYPKIKIIGF